MTARNFVRFAIAFNLLNTACGTTKDEAKKELDENKITLDPPAGTYSYKPWIRLKKQDNGMGSGILKAKAPGKTEFSSSTTCGIHSPYPNTDIFEDCVEIEQTGQLVYFLENSAAKSGERTADFTINLSTHNLSGGFATAAGQDKEPLEFSELETFCRYDSDGQRLNVSIQLANDSNLTAQKYAYLLFSIKDPAAGVSQTYTKDNETKVSLKIKPRTDDVQDPGNDFSVDYDSRPLFDTVITSVSPTVETESQKDSEISPESVAPNCTFSMETAERGATNKGTLKCSNLTYSNSEPNPALGAYVDLSGNWQCDRYK